eukprot:6247112-Amphidinium_carterae.1
MQQTPPPYPIDAHVQMQQQQLWQQQQLQQQQQQQPQPQQHLQSQPQHFAAAALPNQVPPLPGLIPPDQLANEVRQPPRDLSRTPARRQAQTLYTTPPRGHS